MIDMEKIQQLINLIPELGMTIKDHEIMVDGNSVGLVTSKLNAFISVMMKDQPEAVKDEFRAAWKAEYRRIATGKITKSIEILENDNVWGILGVTEPEMVNEMKSEVIPQLKAAIEKVEEMVTITEALIDKAEV